MGRSSDFDQPVVASPGDSRYHLSYFEEDTQMLYWPVFDWEELVQIGNFGRSFHYNGQLVQEQASH